MTISEWKKNKANPSSEKILISITTIIMSSIMTFCVGIKE